MCNFKLPTNLFPNYSTMDDFLANLVLCAMYSSQIRIQIHVSYIKKIPYKQNKYRKNEEHSFLQKTTYCRRNHYKNVVFLLKKQFPSSGQAQMKDMKILHSMVERVIIMEKLLIFSIK